MNKRSKKQMFRDPIYGYITVEYEIITKLINTSEFQRLRRIRQLAGVSMIYPGAEHSRFAHSLGVYHLANEFIENTELKVFLTLREQLLFLVSALLHDIGHGPYSHAFEDVFNTDHEQFSSQIILNRSNIKNILDEVDNKFAEDVSNIILGKSSYKIIEQLISSQLDVDRLDYLKRDTYYTGAFYGHIDVSHIIKTMRIKNGLVTFEESAISTIENYLISRYHMYWQVYFHPGTRAYELILEKIYLRMKEVLNNFNNRQFNNINKFINDQNDLETYLKIDDYYINGLVASFLDSEDKILKVLSNDFINRTIWENTIANSDIHKEIINKYSIEQIKYFTATTTAYEETYRDDIKNLANNIYILKNDGSISTLVKESTIISSLISSGTKKDERFFFKIL